MLARVVDAYRCRLEIGIEAVVDIAEMLRVAVEKREHRALHLHHDAVTCLECVYHVVEFEPKCGGLVGFKRLGMTERVAVFATHDFPAYEVLTPLFIDIDDLHDEVGIGGRGADSEVDFGRTHDGERL